MPQSKKGQQIPRGKTPSVFYPQKSINHLILMHFSLESPKNEGRVSDH